MRGFFFSKKNYSRSGLDERNNIKVWRDAFCSLRSHTVSLGAGRRQGWGWGVRSCGRGGPARGAHPGAGRSGAGLPAQYFRFSRRLGYDTSRNAGVPICPMSQKQWNESYSLSPHRPPFTDMSCGFFLTLSLTHSIERNARFRFWRKEKKNREKGWRERGREG